MAASARRLPPRHLPLPLNWRAPESSSAFQPPLLHQSSLLAHRIDQRCSNSSPRPPLPTSASGQIAATGDASLALAPPIPPPPSPRRREPLRSPPRQPRLAPMSTAAAARHGYGRLT